MTKTETKSGKCQHPPDADSGGGSFSFGEATEEVSLYDYNGFDQLIKATRGSKASEYTYLPSGLRYSKMVDGVATTFALDGGNVVVESQDGTAVLSLQWPRRCRTSNGCGGFSDENLCLNAIKICSLLSIQVFIISLVYLEGRISKSISRVSRDTLEILKIIRFLRERGINMYFETEDLDSINVDKEFEITLRGMLAQDESRNTSENIQWGFGKGKGGLEMRDTD